MTNKHDSSTTNPYRTPWRQKCLQHFFAYIQPSAHNTKAKIPSLLVLCTTLIIQMQRREFSILTWWLSVCCYQRTLKVVVLRTWCGWLALPSSRLGLHHHHHSPHPSHPSCWSGGGLACIPVGVDQVTNAFVLGNMYAINKLILYIRILSENKRLISLY